MYLFGPKKNKSIVGGLSFGVMYLSFHNFLSFVLSFVFVIRCVGWINMDCRLLLLLPGQSLHLLSAVITSPFVNAVSPVHHDDVSGQ